MKLGLLERDQHEVLLKWPVGKTPQALFCQSWHEVLKFIVFIHKVLGLFSNLPDWIKKGIILNFWRTRRCRAGFPNSSAYQPLREVSDCSLTFPHKYLSYENNLINTTLTNSTDSNKNNIYFLNSPIYLWGLILTTLERTSVESS